MPTMYNTEDPNLDKLSMIRALALARKGLYTTSPNPRVGCVIIDPQGKTIGESYHQKAGQAHAEVMALQQAGAAARGATAYVTLEPCAHHGQTPPCADALISAGIARVVYGMEDPNPKVAGSGLDKLEAAGICVSGPLFEDEALALNPGFVKRMRLAIPYVRCKMAMSLDGRTAMASGESKWITGPTARLDVQTLRARSCAIITGVDSVIQDDPALSVRLDQPTPNRQPLRVVVDSQGRCPSSAAILQQPGRTVIATCASKPSSTAGETWQMPAKNGRVDLYALLRKLANEGCNEVLLETGSVLAGAFVAQALVDEFVIYMAAKLMGSQARPLFTLPIGSMSAQLPLSIEDIRAVGSDFRIIAKPDPDG